MSDLPDFAALERLKKDLAKVHKTHAITMAHYRSDDGCGFYHQPSKRHEASLSSSATCIASLVHTGQWIEGSPWWDSTNAMAQKLLERPWRSAGLDANNPFSVSFIVEGILDLQQGRPNYHYPHWLEYQDAATHLGIIKQEAVPILRKSIRHGSVSIDSYPASAYLTQLVFRVLKRVDSVTARLAERIHCWSVAEITKQIALLSANSRLGDPLNLAYALILAVQTVGEEQTRPEEKEISLFALDLFFRKQKEDGSWPPSQPLFHYPKVGSAHCYEYELLTQLLTCAPLRDDLLQYIPQLSKAVSLLEKTKFDLSSENPGTLVAWASGHHPQLPGPESWSTASVYHFAFVLDRLVSEAIRRAVFQELGAIYATPNPSKDPSKDTFAADLLDAHIKPKDGAHRSLRETLAKEFVFPIAKETRRVAGGGSLSGSTPMSAILFGPPGVSKTRLATYISTFLGWPLLTVDPSYLVQKGLDRIQAQANHLFNMLGVAEQVVVLLDEFDEMGRDRSRSQELLSRFITTAMLPKLVSINEQRKIVFLLATNFISGFDAAFSRGGRFDLLIQVMPPTGNEKLAHWAALKAAYDKLPEDRKHEAHLWIEDLTYAECKRLVSKLAPDLTQDFIYRLIEGAWKAGTLNQPNEIGGSEKELTWKNTSEVERNRIRLNT